ncbi:hypothetical protein SAMD00019534_072240 [Acytostelium subglobosum LB1]|uniref:hypothetical protein n=1 Tax=Acytostelium subglobosum LB1 TaxID=1410327 RepID=UPI000644D26E|nr:hypothetical protein SAMD00019534_072240 [Acytostelium subglobosum LB1]GAM24049.1 hypothetical protein SAMD00019534_072240 [Acytostelium subglobosum LB1]|eukprot:XP_012753085.1 hypothetical protein SAMD00019534_072240 [Acytostelium subglobosum LB1]
MLLLSLVLFWSQSSCIDSRPTTLSTFRCITNGNFTLFNFTSGQLIQNQVSPFVVDLLQCSGNDYMVMVQGLGTDMSISIFNGQTGELTTKAMFNEELANDGFIIYQVNSVDLESGLALATYCDNTSVSNLAIFDLNNQSVVNIPFKGNKCMLYAYGQYDSTTHLYYLYGYNVSIFTGIPIFSLPIGIYSLKTKTFEYVEIPYYLDMIGGSVQQLYMYQSTLYACIQQDKHIEIGVLDISAKKFKRVFKVETNTNAQFAFDQSGYIVSLVVNQKDTSIIYLVYSTDLQTHQSTMNIFPQFPFDIESRMLCAQ